MVYDCCVCCVDCLLFGGVVDWCGVWLVVCFLLIVMALLVGILIGCLFVLFECLVQVCFAEFWWFGY